MTRKEAGQKLRETLTACSTEQAQDVRDILHLGAGLIPLPNGCVCSGPATMPLERLMSCANLIDAVYDYDPDSGAQAWTPIHAGAWESVLATLVIEGDWVKIHQTAEDLRADESLVESRKFA